LKHLKKKENKSKRKKKERERDSSIVYALFACAGCNVRSAHVLTMTFLVFPILQLDEIKSFNIFSIFIKKQNNSLKYYIGVANQALLQWLAWPKDGQANPPGFDPLWGNFTRETSGFIFMS
jgi:hypothetical protein